MIQIHWTMLIVITVLKHVYDQRKNGWTDVDAANFSYKLKLIRSKSISVSRSVRHELFIVSVSKNRFVMVFFPQSRIHDHCYKVILSVCFYLNLWQNRIEWPNLFSSFKSVFLLLATFSHPSVNPGVQSNLGFPGRSGVGGYHGTILFLTCPGFLLDQAGSLYNRRFCRVFRRVLMGERSKTRLLASCVRCAGYRGCSGILSPLSIYFWGKQELHKRVALGTGFSVIIIIFLHWTTDEERVVYYLLFLPKFLACIQMPPPLKKKDFFTVGGFCTQATEVQPEP